MTAGCQGTKRDGQPCTTRARPSERWCYHHHLDYADDRRLSASRAANARHSPVARELRKVGDLIWELPGLTIADRLPHRARKGLQNMVRD